MCFDADTLALVEFFRARLGDEEATARAAVPGPWRWGDWNATYGTPELERNALEHSPEHGPFPAPVRLRDAGTIGVLRLEDSLECDPDPEASAAHIARHDPAAVLRDAEADRKLLLALEEAAETSGGDWSEGEAGYADGLEAGLLLAVKIRAGRFSAHPDYRPGWAPIA